MARAASCCSRQPLHLQQHGSTSHKAWYSDVRCVSPWCCCLCSSAGLERRCVRTSLGRSFSERGGQIPSRGNPESWAALRSRRKSGKTLNTAGSAGCRARRPNFFGRGRGSSGSACQARHAPERQDNDAGSRRAGDSCEIDEETIQQHKAAKTSRCATP